MIIVIYCDIIRCRLCFFGGILHCDPDTAVFIIGTSLSSSPTATVVSIGILRIFVSSKIPVALLVFFGLYSKY